MHLVETTINNMSSFTCRKCDCITFGEPANRDKNGKPICKYCLEKQESDIKK